MTNVVYGVYLCGCTDCFLSAIFLDEDHAEAWGKLYATNPEGYVIKDILYDEVSVALREDT